MKNFLYFLVGLAITSGAVGLCVLFIFFPLAGISLCTIVALIGIYFLGKGIVESYENRR